MYVYIHITQYIHTYSIPASHNILSYNMMIYYSIVQPNILKPARRKICLLNHNDQQQMVRALREDLACCYAQSAVCRLKELRGFDRSRSLKLAGWVSPRQGHVHDFVDAGLLVAGTTTPRIGRTAIAIDQKHSSCRCRHRGLAP